MVFIISDDVFGMEMFIPTATPGLLTMCRQYATPEVPAAITGDV